MELLPWEESDNSGPISKSIEIPHDDASIRRYFADGKATKTGYDDYIRLRTSMDTYAINRKPRLFEYLTSGGFASNRRKTFPNPNPNPNRTEQKKSHLSAVGASPATANCLKSSNGQ